MQQIKLFKIYYLNFYLFKMFKSFKEKLNPLSIIQNQFNNFSFLNKINKLINNRLNKASSQTKIANNLVPGLENFKVYEIVNNNIKISKYDKSKNLIYFDIQHTPHRTFKVFDYYNPTAELIKLQNQLSVLKTSEFSKEEIMKQVSKENLDENVKIMLLNLLLNVEVNDIMENNLGIKDISYEQFNKFKSLYDKDIIKIRSLLKSSHTCKVIFENIKNLEIKKYNKESIRLIKALSMTHYADTDLWKMYLANFVDKLELFVNSQQDNYLPFMYYDILEVFKHIFDYLLYNEVIFKVNNCQLPFYKDLQQIYFNYFDILAFIFEECAIKFSDHLPIFLALSTLLNVNESLNQDSKSKYELLLLRLMAKDLKHLPFFLKSLELYQIYYRSSKVNKNELKVFKYFDKELSNFTPYHIYLKRQLDNKKMAEEVKKPLEEETDPKLLDTEIIILESNFVIYFSI
jgi:hypothetical protein